MKLKNNKNILENKTLKTNTQGRRLISVNKTGTDKTFPNGKVTLIQQEEFNQIKKEFKQLKELEENPITKEDIDKLEKNIQDLQEENQELKLTNEKLTEELKETSFNLELALNNETIKEINNQNEKRINDFKAMNEENKKEISTLTSENTALKIALTKTLSEYEHLINRSLLSRIINKEKSELDEMNEYKKLVESKEKYVPEVITTTKRE